MVRPYRNPLHLTVLAAKSEAYTTTTTPKEWMWRAKSISLNIRFGSLAFLFLFSHVLSCSPFLLLWHTWVANLSPRSSFNDCSPANYSFRWIMCFYFSLLFIIRSTSSLVFPIGLFYSPSVSQLLKPKSVSYSLKIIMRLQRMMGNTGSLTRLVKIKNPCCLSGTVMLWPTQPSLDIWINRIL